MTNPSSALAPLESLKVDLTAYSAAWSAKARSTALTEPAAAVGYYEAALAYQDAAQMLTGATLRAARDLDALADRNAAQWPIEGLEDLTSVQTDGPGPHRMPRWGVELDDDAVGDGWLRYLTLAPTTDTGAVILRYSSGEHAEGQAENVRHMRVTADQWRTLNAYAERLFAGHPTPIDRSGVMAMTVQGQNR